MARPTPNLQVDKPLPPPKGPTDPTSPTTTPLLIPATTAVATTPVATTVRPGTSATESLLATNRRRASENYQRAHRAEKQYVARKRASSARREWKASKDHFGEAARHVREGLKALMGVVKRSPYLVQEKQQRGSLRREERRRVRAMEKRRRIEEELARGEEEDRRAAIAEAVGKSHGVVVRDDRVQGGVGEGEGIMVVDEDDDGVLERSREGKDVVETTGGGGRQEEQVPEGEGEASSTGTKRRIWMGKGKWKEKEKA